MPYSYSPQTGDGSTTVFSVPFGYIEKSHVAVKVDGVTTSFTWVTTATIQLASAPDSGATVLVYRTTPLDARLVDFENASLLSEATQDKDSNQMFYIAQEANDNVQDALRLDTDDDKYDANSKVIKDCADPANAQDVVTLNHLDATYVPSMNTIKTACELAETNAELAETAAELAETAAELAETNAEASEVAALASEVAAAASAAAAQASSGIPAIVSGDADKRLTVKADETGLEYTDIDPDIALVDVAQEWSRAQNFDGTTLTFNATQTWNASLNQVAEVTLTGNVTFSAPGNQVDGGTYILTIIQDATGSRTVAWNTAFKWEDDEAPVIDQVASAKTIVVFKSDGTNMFGQVFWKENG